LSIHPSKCLRLARIGEAFHDVRRIDLGIQIAAAVRTTRSIICGAFVGVVVIATSAGCESSATLPSGSISTATGAATVESSDPRLVKENTPSGDTQTFVPIADPTAGQPVVVAAALYPSTGMPDEIVTLAVRIRVAAGWHIGAFATGGAAGPSSPTTIDVELPPGVEAAGEWQFPPPTAHFGPSGRSIGYGEDVTFRRQFRVPADQPSGELVFIGCVEYQACSHALCQRPATTRLRAAMQITK
jgi:DsbC/DsbD-like thiol-disulfide interchange protein